MKKEISMEKKKGFWSSASKILFAIMFVSSWAVIGIAFALKSASVNVSGQIVFNAVDVQVTVSDAKFTDFGCNTDGKCKGFSTDSDTKTDPDTKSWQGLSLTFKESGDNAIITYTITNDDQDGKSIVVTFGQIIGLTGTNSKMAVTVQEGSLTDNVFSGTGSVDTLTAEGKVYDSLASGSTLQVTITFSVDDLNASAQISNFKIPVEMTKPDKTN